MERAAIGVPSRSGIPRFCAEHNAETGITVISYCIENETTGLRAPLLHKRLTFLLLTLYLVTSPRGKHSFTTKCSPRLFMPRLHIINSRPSTPFWTATAASGGCSTGEARHHQGSQRSKKRPSILCQATARYLRTRLGNGKRATVEVLNVSVPTRSKRRDVVPSVSILGGASRTTGRSRRLC